jgi:hypothetical protein
MIGHQGPDQGLAIDPVCLCTAPPSRCHDRGRINDMALKALSLQNPIKPEAIQAGLLDEMIGKSFPVRRRAFSLISAHRASSPAISPPRTAYVDIFSPAPGDSDVISQVERLSANDAKIASRSVRMAVRFSASHALSRMFVSEVRIASGLTLPESGPLSGPWDLNPVEMAFSKKALMRAAARTLDDLSAAAKHALERFTPTDCTNHFAAAGYDAI